MTHWQGIKLPDWVNWIAQDANGCWWGYEVEPLQFDQGWYENEIGRRIRVKNDHPNTDWVNTIIKI